MHLNKMSLKIGAVPVSNRLRVRQSPTAHMPPIPMRACFFANSGGGKTNLIVSLLTNPKLFGGNFFDAVYVVSPSVKVDSTWAHLKNIGPREVKRKMSFSLTSGMVTASRG